MRANDDTDAARFEMLFDRLRDLAREALLNLQAARETVDEPRELADADDFARQVADACLAVERQHVVLAGGVKADAAQDDHLVAALFERAGEDFGGIVGISGRHLAPRLEHARGRVKRAVTRRVFAYKSKDGGDGLGCGIGGEIENFGLLVHVWET